MPIIFSTKPYEYMVDRMIDHTDKFKKGSLTRKTFPDGEKFKEISTGVRDRDVVLVGATITDSDTMELYDLACGIVEYGARSLTIVIPFYGYATMERARPFTREIVTAKTRAKLLSSIPKAYMGTRFVLFDLHTDTICNYFENVTGIVHVYGDPFVQYAYQDLSKDVSGDIVLASTDAGGAKRVERLAKGIGCESAFLSKRRVDGQTTQITNINADVVGKHVLIQDDMIRSGSSLYEAADAYKQAGAISVSAVITHGVFTEAYDYEITNLPDDTRKRCKGKIDRLYLTDSHLRAKWMWQELDTETEYNLIRFYSISNLLTEAVIHHLPRGWGKSD